VGAYVLAGELSRATGAYQVAFARYEAVMRDYVKQCQEQPPGGVEGMLPRTARAIWMRNLSMRMMTRWPIRNVVAGIFHKADCIALDHYDVQPPSSRACVESLRTGQDASATRVVSIP
jgi:hypothetical protein